MNRSLIVILAAFGLSVSAFATVNVIPPPQHVPLPPNGPVSDDVSIGGWPARACLDMCDAIGGSASSFHACMGACLIAKSTGELPCEFLFAFCTAKPEPDSDACMLRSYKPLCEGQITIQLPPETNPVGPAAPINSVGSAE